MVEFRDGRTPNPQFLMMKSCNSFVNIKYLQNRIPNLPYSPSTANETKKAAVVVPTCLALDADGETCALCREELNREDGFHSVTSSDIDASEWEVLLNRSSSRWGGAAP